MRCAALLTLIASLCGGAIACKGGEDKGPTDGFLVQIVLPDGYHGERVAGLDIVVHSVPGGKPLGATCNNGGGPQPGGNTSGGGSSGISLQVSCPNTNQVVISYRGSAFLGSSTFSLFLASPGSRTATFALRVSALASDGSLYATGRAGDLIGHALRFGVPGLAGTIAIPLHCAPGVRCLDSPLPATPVLSGVSPASPSNVTEPTLSGTAPAGSLVRVYVDAGCALGVVGEGTADATGHFAVELALDPNASYTFYATASDSTGQTSACSTASSPYVEDSQPPTWGGYETVPLVASALGPESINLSFPTPQFRNESGISYDVCATAAPTPCTGFAEFTPQYLTSYQAHFVVPGLTPDTLYTFAIRLRDQAGNVSAAKTATARTMARTGTAVAISGRAAILATGQSSVFGSGNHFSTDAPSPSGASLTAAAGTCTLDASGNVACGGGVTFTGAAALTNGGALVCAQDASGGASCQGAATSWGGGGGGSGTCGWATFHPIASEGIVSVSADSAACALHGDGHATCTTPNAVYCTGNFGTTCGCSSDTTSELAGLGAALGLAGSYVLLADGRVRARDSTEPLADLDSVLALAGDSGHLCALLADGTVRCWGKNSTGELGDGTLMPSATPVAVVGLSNAIALGVEGHGSCALLASGDVRCWGADVGPLPVPIDGLVGPIAVKGLTAGAEHTCALLSNGRVRCWGRGDSGQLGDGTMTTRSAPAGTASLEGAVALAAGSAHVCARVVGGVQCWGKGADGQLGRGDAQDRATPSAVGIADAKSIAAGAAHTCALRADGLVQCWGKNDAGQLGDGTTATRTTPTLVAGLEGVTEITAGERHACALLVDHTIRCWGQNDDRQLGDGTAESRATAVAVAGIDGATALAAGTGHTCARLVDGSVRCWGRNALGQLGDGTTTARTTPRTVANLDRVTALAAGKDFTCARMVDGTVRCWGDNAAGQLGDGTTTARVSAVTAAVGQPATAVATGAAHACARLGNGSLVCWGQNGAGQLGDGTSTARATPTAVTNLP